MTADIQRRYRFATSSQWSTCAMAGADADALRAGGGVRPFAPYARSAELHPSAAARAPVVTRAGEMLWCSGDHQLNRVMRGDDDPLTMQAPGAIARASRVVANAAGLWVTSASGGALECFEEDSLSRRFVVAVPGGRIVDIATDGRESVFALAGVNKAWSVARIDRRGRVVDIRELADIENAEAFVFLRDSGRFAVLAASQRLHWFAPDSASPMYCTVVAGLAPCFEARKLGSDARQRVVVAGEEKGTTARRASVISLDADGTVVTALTLDARDADVSGVVATRDSLLVTGPRGLLRFTTSDTVPEGDGEVRCTFITPMLRSPARQDGRQWLRVDAQVSLPEGSSVEIAFAATDDVNTRDRLDAISRDRSASGRRQVDALLADATLWRGQTTYHGTVAATDDARTVASAKLFDVHEEYLWVSVSLSAGSGGRLPELTDLAVLYPGLTLMERLPAIYQEGEGEPENFLRGLVGVLEATTQGLDARIAAMGRMVHPSTAPAKWLDYIARWLGVPWDDALALPQKRAIVSRASELAKGRGTRAGLQALLECLLPGMPARFRITDATADMGFAVIGGLGCTGSVLPAMLGGHTRWHAELDATAVLGSTRLPCPGQLDDGVWQLAGKIRVEVAATSAERAAWAPWLLSLISEMVPVTTRPVVRWVSARSLRGDRLVGTLVLESAPTTLLGSDAITGLARLPERGTRLSASGSQISTRLR